MFWMGGQDTPGVKIPRVWGKIPRDIFTPEGQAAQGGKINCYTGNSVGCASVWYSRVRSSGPAKYFVEIGHEIVCQLLAVVCYWRNDVFLVLVNRLKNLPRESVVRLTDGSPYMPQMPGYLKTHIIIITIIIINLSSKTTNT